MRVVGRWWSPRGLRWRRAHRHSVRSPRGAGGRRGGRRGPVRSSTLIAGPVHRTCLTALASWTELCSLLSSSAGRRRPLKPSSATAHRACALSSPSPSPSPSFRGPAVLVLPARAPAHALSATPLSPHARYVCACGGGSALVRGATRVRVLSRADRRGWWWRPGRWPLPLPASRAAERARLVRVRDRPDPPLRSRYHLPSAAPCCLARRRPQRAGTIANAPKI